MVQEIQYTSLYLDKEISMEWLAFQTEKEFTDYKPHHTPKFLDSLIHEYGPSKIGL